MEEVRRSKGGEGEEEEIQFRTGRKEKGQVEKRLKVNWIRTERLG